jgi:hypothetical protein
LSELALFDRPLIRWGTYGLAALLFVAEAAIATLMLRPDVPPDFREYYIDRTTTCLNQPFPGTYAFGTIVDFTSPGREQALPLRVCGWEGPAGDGTHAVGTRSRLRMTGDAPAGPQELRLDMVAVTRNGEPQPQRVEVVLDGTLAATLDVAAGEPQPFSVPVPADALGDRRLEVIFEFPDAVKMGPADPETRYRSIKLLSAGIVPATGT